LCEQGVYDREAGLLAENLSTHGGGVMARKHYFWFRAVSLVFVLTAGILPAHAIQATFDSNDGGWGAALLNGTSASSVVYQSSGGNQGGYISTTDPILGTWYFAAPSTFFYGDMSSYIGKTLSYDIAVRYQGEFFGDSEVVIRSNNTTAAWNKGTEYIQPSQDFVWTTCSIELTSSNFSVTEDEFQTVMANVTGFFIRADYMHGSDYIGLDNVYIGEGHNTVPEPMSLLLVLPGFVGFLVRRIKK
jgi:hypothetical protein